MLLALLPLAKAKLIVADGVIIDAKSGVSGAGRTLKQNILFSESGEGLSPYGIGNHRHVPEIEQELSAAAGSRVTVNFTPHLVPMSRGELCTCYVALAVAKLPERVKVIDMSADFRLRDPAVYAEWYGGEHSATQLLKQAVYGLTEHYAKEIKAARLVACPGCYPTAVLLALLPLAKAKLIVADGVIIDAKSGVTGAGRTLKQNILFF